MFESVHALLNQLIDHEEGIIATCDALSELDWYAHSLVEEILADFSIAVCSLSLKLLEFTTGIDRV